MKYYYGHQQEFDLIEEKKENYKWNSYLINNTFDKYGTQSIMSYLPTYYVLDKNKKIISKYYSLDEIPFLKLK